MDLKCVVVFDLMCAANFCVVCFVISVVILFNHQLLSSMRKSRLLRASKYSGFVTSCLRVVSLDSLN